MDLVITLADNLEQVIEIQKILSNNAAMSEPNSLKFTPVDFQQLLALVRNYIFGGRIHLLVNLLFQLENPKLIASNKLRLEENLLSQSVNQE